MALINQNELFDQLQEYIDRKMDILTDQLRELFEEYHLKEIFELGPIMIEIVEHMDDIVLIGENMEAIVIVAANTVPIIKVAYIADDVVKVADIDEAVAITASISTSIVEVSTEPLRQAILDAEGNAINTQLQAWEAKADRFTAASYAVESGTVIEYTSNGDGTFSTVDTGLPSAKSSADEIKSVTVVSPVDSVPNLPDGKPGLPTVIYHPTTGAFQFGIPIGATGIGFIAMGDATVAAINALPDAGNNPSEAWSMLDAGTITSGTEDIVVAIEDWIVWAGVDQKWINIGQAEGPAGPVGPVGPQGPGFEFQGEDSLDNILLKPATINHGWKSMTAGMMPDAITPVAINDILSGNGTAWSNIGGLEGPKGDTGDTGPQGDEGIQGPIGIPGIDGTDGAQGIQGEIGPMGPEGPEGPEGEPAPGITPVGGATVAELNALVADPVIGNAYWMEDAGTITYGTEPTVVLINEVVVWVSEGYFFNMGVIESGTSWGAVTDVTVDGVAPALGDDLASTSAVLTKNDLQDTAIALNTAKVTGSDRILKAGDTMTGPLNLANAVRLHGYDSLGVLRNLITLEANDIIAFGSVGLPISTQAIIACNTVPTAVDHLTRKDYVDSRVVQVTQAEYDALTPDPAVMYAIIG